MENVQHLSNTGSHYTPSDIVESARNIMGSIDCDPASDEHGQLIVNATKYFTKDDDAINNTYLWEGNCFLNPPGGLVKLSKSSGKWEHMPNRSGGGTKSSQAVWAKTAIDLWENGKINQLFFVAFSIEVLSKEPRLLRYPITFTTMNAASDSVTNSGRIRFDKLDNGVRIPGNSPTHSNALIWIPKKLDLIHKGVRNIIPLFQQHTFRFGLPGLFSSNQIYWEAMEDWIQESVI